MKPGDLVQLRSGSPCMTVTSINTGYCGLQWYEKGAWRKQYLHERALVPVTTFDRLKIRFTRFILARSMETQHG